MKICTKCKQSLPATLEYFYKSVQGKQPLRSVCKLCMSMYYKQLYKDNTQRILERGKKYRKTKIGHLRSVYSGIQSRLKHHPPYLKRGIQCKFKTAEEFILYCLVSFPKIDFVKSICHRIDNDGNYESNNIKWVGFQEHYDIHKAARLESVS